MTLGARLKSDTLCVKIARSPADLRAAQRLRYQVFVDELGGDGPLVDHDAKLERDIYDDHAAQMILVDPSRDPEAGNHVVGVYRLLDGAQAQAVGGFYSESEYDLAPLKASGRSLLELGRSCLHPDFRGGTAMFHLWQGIAAYISEHSYEVLFGVASFHGTDVAALSAPLAHLHHAHLAPPDLRPRARAYQSMNLLPAGAIDRPKAMKATPALIKAYLRLGGVVGDGAFVDHAFNTVDVCLVLDTQRISAKHRDIYDRAP